MVIYYNTQHRELVLNRAAAYLGNLLPRYLLSPVWFLIGYMRGSNNLIVLFPDNVQNTSLIIFHTRLQTYFPNVTQVSRIFGDKPEEYYGNYVSMYRGNRVQASIYHRIYTLEKIDLKLFRRHDKA